MLLGVLFAEEELVDGFLDAFVDLVFGDYELVWVLFSHYI